MPDEQARAVGALSGRAGAIDIVDATVVEVRSGVTTP